LVKKPKKKKKRYRCVCIKKPLIDEVDQLITDPNSPVKNRYKSIAEFVTDALRRHLEHVQALYLEQEKPA